MRLFKQKRAQPAQNLCTSKYRVHRPPVSIDNIRQDSQDWLKIDLGSKHNITIAPRRIPSGTQLHFLVVCTFLFLTLFIFGIYYGENPMFYYILGIHFFFATLCCKILSACNSLNNLWISRVCPRLCSTVSPTWVWGLVRSLFSGCLIDWRPTLLQYSKWYL